MLALRSSRDSNYSYSVVPLTTGPLSGESLSGSARLITQLLQRANNALLTRIVTHILVGTIIVVQPGWLLSHVWGYVLGRFDGPALKARVTAKKE